MISMCCKLFCHRSSLRPTESSDISWQEYQNVPSLGDCDKSILSYITNDYYSHTNRFVARDAEWLALDTSNLCRCQQKLRQ